MATGHETCAAYQIVNCLNGMNSTRDAVLYYLEGRDVKENPLTGTSTTSILALLDDARGEPAQGAPGVSINAVTKIDYLYKSWRNKIDSGATSILYYADDETTVDHKLTHSKTGTTYTQGEVGTGA